MSKDLDGVVPQSSLAYAEQTTVAYMPPMEGVVVGIHYPADRTNRSKTEMEYDVDITSMGNVGRLKNVPRMHERGGIDDGDEDVLRAADSAANGGNFVPDGANATPRNGTTGDRVIVNFINGNPERPFIQGVLTHRKVRRRKLSPKNNKRGAPQRESVFRGNRLVEDYDGNMFLVIEPLVDSKGRTVQDSDKEKTLQIQFGDFFITLNTVNEKTVFSVDRTTGNGEQMFAVKHDGVYLGSQDFGGMESVGLGPSIAKFFSDFLDVLMKATVVTPAGAGTFDPGVIAQLAQLKVKSELGGGQNPLYSNFALVSKKAPTP